MHLEAVMVLVEFLHKEASMLVTVCDSSVSQDHKHLL